MHSINPFEELELKQIYRKVYIIFSHQDIRNSILTRIS